jgi:hypothetical protein
MIYENKLIKLFTKRIVLTFKEVSKTVQCSHDTLGRFLKRHGFYSSSNKNGSYYILAKDCEFDKNGIFFYNDIMFSKYKTIKNTVLNFVDKSDCGVSTSDVIGVFGVNSKTALSNLYTGKEISRQMYNGTFYYFSADAEAGLFQRESRKRSEAEKTNEVPEKKKLPSTQIIIAILTAVVIRIGADAKQIRGSLKKQGLNISLCEVNAVLQHYKIPEKKT